VDAGLVLVAMWLSALLQELLRPSLPALREPPSFEQFAVLAYLVLPLWLLLGVVFRLHVAVPERIGAAELFVRLVKLHVAGLAVLSVAQFLTQSVINRSLAALFMACAFGLMFVQRRLALAWLRFHARGTGPLRVLLVGRPSRRMHDFVRAAAAAPDPPELLGYLEAPMDGKDLSQPPPGATPVPRLGAVAQLREVLHAHAVDHVMFLPPSHRPELSREQLIACEEVGVAASFSVDLVQLAAAAPKISALYDHPFVTFEVSPKQAEALAIKYGLDPLLAALGLALLSPLLLAMSLAIWLTMGRPILFSQERAGLNGRPFRMLKFRTMRVGAEQQREALVGDNEMSGPVFKIRDDPRITPLGRALRKTSLDELPQLWNVLTGSMSLVGPRPLPVSEHAQIEGWQRRRLTMKPGITCLWQVSGRNDVDFVEWMLLDLQYIDQWSLWLDLLILLKTVPVVVLGRGAH
jgi:exopolysaccharide biosynthesis polyprenyl glycosylphosphotransferase